MNLNHIIIHSGVADSSSTLSSHLKPSRYTDFLNKYYDPVLQQIRQVRAEKEEEITSLEHDLNLIQKSKLFQNRRLGMVAHSRKRDSLVLENAYVEDLEKTVIKLAKMDYTLDHFNSSQGCEHLLVTLKRLVQFQNEELTFGELKTKHPKPHYNYSIESLPKLKAKLEHARKTLVEKVQSLQNTGGVHSLPLPAYESGKYPVQRSVYGVVKSTVTQGWSNLWDKYLGKKTHDPAENSHLVKRAYLSEKATDAWNWVLNKKDYLSQDIPHFTKYLWNGVRGTAERARGWVQQKLNSFNDRNSSIYSALETTRETEPDSEVLAQSPEPLFGQGQTKVGIISDIHGNLEALTSVLNQFKEDGITRIVNLGDVVGYGPDPRKCIQLLKEYNVVSILGNHDVRAIQRIPNYADFRDVARESGQFARKQLQGTDEAKYLQSLPRAITFQEADGTEIFVCHGTPGDSAHTLTESYALKENVLAGMSWLENRKSESGKIIALFGHTHLQGMYHVPMDYYNYPSKARSVQSYCATFQLDDVVMINPGSVGQARGQIGIRANSLVNDKPTAGYAILEKTVSEAGNSYSVDFRACHYDVDQTIKKIKESNLPDQCWQRLLNGV